MIQSFTDNVDVINIVLSKLKKETLLISDMEQEMLKEFGEFLSICSDATTRARIPYHVHMCLLLRKYIPKSCPKS